MPLYTAPEAELSTRTLPVSIPVTPEMVPSSVTIRKPEATPLIGKAIEVLPAIPVGLERPPLRNGIDTATGSGCPEPRYSVAFPVAWLVIQNGELKTYATPQGSTR